MILSWLQDRSPSTDVYIESKVLPSRFHWFLFNIKKKLFIFNVSGIRGIGLTRTNLKIFCLFIYADIKLLHYDNIDLKINFPRFLCKISRFSFMLVKCIAHRVYVSVCVRNFSELIAKVVCAKYQMTKIPNKNCVRCVIILFP